LANDAYCVAQHVKREPKVQGEVLHLKGPWAQLPRVKPSFGDGLVSEKLRRQSNYFI